MNVKDYNIALIPSEDLIAKSIKVSQSLEHLGTAFTLSFEAFIPHISLYMLRLDGSGKDQVKALLTEFAPKASGLSLRAKTYYTTARFFEVQYEVGDELVDLQNKVIAACSPFRIGMLASAERSLLKAEGVARANIVEYGYKYIGEFFRPHITLTRFVEDQPANILDLPIINIFNGTSVGLGLYEMDQNGACIKRHTL